jgi:uncharacterized protein YukE
MDNEREVNQNQPERRDGDETNALIERSKMLFLQEVLEQAGEEAQQYDIQQEFAKTKRNRSIVVPGIILLLVALFGVGMYFTTQQIERSTRDVQVTIEDVEDVDLMEVLDTAQRLETRIAAVQDRINNLENERDEQIEEIQGELERDIRLVREQTNLSEGQRNTRIANARNEAEEEIQQVRDEFGAQIEEAEQELADLQQRLDQYDARRLEQARQQEEVLDNQARLHEIEMQELRSDYESRIEEIRSNYEERIAELENFQEEFEQRMRERHERELEQLTRELTLRYNPDLSNEEIAALLNEALEETLLNRSDIADFDQRLSAEDVIGRDAYQSLAAEVGGFQQIINRIQDVPYENSIPRALEQLEYRNRRIIEEYEEMWMELADTVDQRDDIIAQREEVIAARDRAIRQLETTIGDLEARIGRFAYALQGLSTENRENGYILDPRRTDQILVYVDRLRDIEAGTVGLVFRQDDEFIGRIRFQSGPEGTTTASLVELAEGKELQPFDKVLIVVQ